MTFISTQIHRMKQRREYEGGKYAFKIPRAFEEID